MTLLEILQRIDFDEIIKKHEVHRAAKAGEKVEELEKRVNEIEMKSGKGKPSKKRRFGKLIAGLGIAGFIFLSGYTFAYRSANEKISEAYKKIEWVNHDLSLIHNDIGNLYDEQKMPAVAIFQYEKAIELDNKHNYAYYNLGLTYIRNGDYQKAEEYLKKAVEINPSSATVRKVLGDSYLYQKKYKEAKKEYLESIKIESSYEPAYRNLGKVYSLLGEYYEAEYNLIKSINLLPEDPLAHLYLGEVYQLQKDYIHAEIEYNHTIGLEPNNEDAHYKLSILYKFIGRPSKSKKHFNIAKDLANDTKI